MLEERREWVMKYLEDREFTDAPADLTDFYERNNVLDPA